MISGSTESRIPASHTRPGLGRETLPRLAYISDLPVGDFGNSPKIMLGLFSDYPADCLKILVSDFWDWPGEKLFTRVPTESFRVRWRFANFGRLFALQSTQLMRHAPARAKEL